MLKGIDALVDKIDYYISHGYMEHPNDLHDDPYSEAERVLFELSKVAPELCKKYCIHIIKTPSIRDEYFNATCLSYLFDLDKEYALDYVEKNIKSMSAPVLRASMDGLSQYSNTSFRNRFTSNLIKEIKERYDEIAITDFEKEMLTNSYEMFSNIFLAT